MSTGRAAPVPSFKSIVYRACVLCIKIYMHTRAAYPSRPEQQINTTKSGKLYLYSNFQLWRNLFNAIACLPCRSPHR